MAVHEDTFPEREGEGEGILEWAPAEEEGPGTRTMRHVGV
jgi:hypothetical protein